MSKQIDQLAAAIVEEARNRAYIRALIPDLYDNKEFYNLMLEVLEIVLHKRGYVIVQKKEAGP